MLIETLEDEEHQPDAESEEVEKVHLVQIHRAETVGDILKQGEGEDDDDLTLEEIQA